MLHTLTEACLQVHGLWDRSGKARAFQPLQPIEGCGYTGHGSGGSGCGGGQEVVSYRAGPWEQPCLPHDAFQRVSSA